MIKRTFVMALSGLLFISIIAGCKKNNNSAGPSGPSNTRTCTATSTYTISVTTSATRTRTVLVTPSVTATWTPTFTATSTRTATGTRTSTPSITVTPTSTDFVSPTVSPTSTPAPTCAFLLGNPNTGAYSGSENYSYVWANQYIPASTITVNSITVGLSNTTNYWAAIYSDNGSDYPGSPIVQTAELNAPTTGMYTTFITQQTLTAGTKYWLVVRAQSANLMYDTNASYGHRYYIGYSYATIIAGTPPPGGTSWGYESGYQTRISLSYCNY